MSLYYEAERKPSLFDDDQTPVRKDQQNNEKRTGDHLRICNDEPEEFPATTKNMWISTVNLAKKINSLMKPIFEDYYGSLLQNENGRITCTLFFKPSSSPYEKDSKRAFAPIGVTNKQDSAKAKIDAINQLSNRTRNFAITEYASELLSDLMMKNCKVDPFNPATYKNYTSEYNSRNMMGQCIYCVVAGIDLMKLLGVIYGFKDKKTKTRNLFQVIPQRPVGSTDKTQATPNANWLCLITLLSEAELNNILQSSGLLPMYGDIPAVSEVD